MFLRRSRRIPLESTAGLFPCWNTSSLEISVAAFTTRKRRCRVDLDRFGLVQQNWKVYLALLSIETGCGWGSREKIIDDHSESSEKETVGCSETRRVGPRHRSLLLNEELRPLWFYFDWELMSRLSCEETRVKANSHSAATRSSN